jgi:hypothetical protein
MLNGETRRAPGPLPVAHTQTAWEGVVKVLKQTTTGKISIAPWTDQPTQGKKRN